MYMKNPVQITGVDTYRDPLYNLQKIPVQFTGIQYRIYREIPVDFKKFEIYLNSDNRDPLYNLQRIPVQFTGIPFSIYRETL